MPPWTRTPPILQLYVTLMEYEPLIWRRIRVRRSITLPRLHDVLQVLMGWNDSHLHEFQAGAELYGQMEPDPPPEMRDEVGVRLGDLVQEAGQCVTYLYDFGDNWKLDLLVEEVLPAEPGVKYAQLLDGERAGPPDDVGGVHGYADCLAAIANPKHPDHQKWTQWLGEEFDPNAIDFERLNWLLPMLGR